MATHPSPTPVPETRRTATAALVAFARGLPDDRPARRLVLNEVVTLNRGVAEAVAARYRRRGVDDDDLAQAAYEGLVKAVRRYDPDRSEDLLAFAVPTIRGEVQRHFRDRTWAVRPPRAVQELEVRVRHESDRLTQLLGREATVDELAASLGVEVERCAEAMNAHGAYGALSLDRPLGSSADGEGGERTLASTLDSSAAAPGTATWGETPDFVRVDDVLTLAPALRRLEARDRLVVQLRYVEELTQREIGERLGVTQTHVSRLLRRALAQLRSELTAA